MSGSKFKNIIILVLLGLNICLLAFNMGSAEKERRLREEARSNAIAHLQQMGRQIEEEQVPRSITLLPQNVVRDIRKEQELAQTLLSGAVEMEDRGAQVYRYYNEKGSVQFHSNGEFSAAFFSGAEQALNGNVQQHAADVLARIGFTGQLLEHSAKGTTQSLRFQEYWGEVPLLSCQATVNYEGQTLMSITGGRRLPGEPVEDTQKTPVSVATALMKFYNQSTALGDVWSQVMSITEGYTITSTISETMPLVPVWIISTDTGTYQLDMLTGALTRSTIQ